MTLTTALLLALAATIIGFGKMSISGLASIAIAIFAFVMPTRESTAAILLLLIVGDLVAVRHYRRDADLALLKRLIPAVLPGIAVGTLFLARVDDLALRRTIGGMLLAMALLQLHLSWRSLDTSRIASSRGAAVATGVACGFATMTANAAGAVMTLYLVAQGVEKSRFLGTGAVFFLGINLAKLPFSAGLGLFSIETLWRTVALMPFVLLGAWLGLHTARRLSQSRFDRAVLAATVVSALVLVAR